MEIDPRESQRIRNEDMRNWRNWQPERLAEYLAFWGCRPDDHLRITPRIVFGHALMAAVVVIGYAAMFLSNIVRLKWLRS